MTAIYTIIGTEGVLIEKKLEDILKQQQIPKGDTSIYDMRESPVQEALFDVQSAAFLSPKKAIIMKNPDFLTGKEAKGPDHRLDAFTSFLENPVTDNILILLAPYEKLDERKKLVKLLKKKSQVFTFEATSEASAREWAQQRLTASGIQVEPQALALLLRLTHGKLDHLRMECEKFETYFLGSESPALTEDIVSALVAKQLEDNVFLLTDALVRQDSGAAYAIYQDLKTQNEEPFRLLVLIANQFRLMSQVGALSKKGYREVDIGRLLSTHPYRVKLINQQAYRFNPSALEAYLYQAARMDHLIKTGQLDKNLALDMLILNVR